VFATRTSRICNSSTHRPFFTTPKSIRAGAAQRLEKLAYLHHSDIGYVPLPTPSMVAHCAPPPTWTVVARAANLSGSWQNITQGDGVPITKPVFTAFIDHGVATNPTDISTTYAIVPGVRAQAMPAVMEEFDHMSVRATWNVSAVCFDNKRLDSKGKKSAILGPGINTTMMASFWSIGAEIKLEKYGCWDLALSAVNSVTTDHEAKLFTINAEVAPRCAGASAAQQDRHCDLQSSRALRQVRLSNYTACLAACCADMACDCWTWTRDERGTGPECMLKQSNVPLQPAAGLWGGNNPKRAKSRPAAPEGVIAIVNDVSAAGNQAVQISVSDPTAKLTSATVELSGQWQGDCTPFAGNVSSLLVNLPTGAHAGSTVTFTCIRLDP
jgi:hypothetical protein